MNRMKKTLVILLAVLFLVTVTAGAVSASAKQPYVKSDIAKQPYVISIQSAPTTAQITSVNPIDLEQRGGKKKG